MLETSSCALLKPQLKERTQRKSEEFSLERWPAFTLPDPVQAHLNVSTAFTDALHKEHVPIKDGTLP